MNSLPKTINAAFSGLTDRQKEVLSGRFGLGKKGEKETLAAIGDRLSVTRERIRQIENSAMASARSALSTSGGCEALLSKVKKYLGERGGVARKSDVLSFVASFAKDISENQLDFIAEVSGAFGANSGNDELLPFYYLSEKHRKAAMAFGESWTNHLRSHKEKFLSGLNEAAYHAQLAAFSKNKSLETRIAENFLGLMKTIKTSPYGEIGLNEWPEVNPSTIRDKIYLVLKRRGEPLHFEDIAKGINKAGFDDQIALAPTVHNELIKDERFVLVGRGIYALREQGYEPGIAREVIAKILKRHGPMNAEEILRRVQEERLFKPNTVLINLQNKNFFERLSDHRYRVRES